MSKLRIWLLVGAGIAVFAAANVHLIYVAFASQPACVPHLKDRDADGGGYRAAKSGC